MDAERTALVTLAHVIRIARSIIYAWQDPWLSLWYFELIWVELTGRPFATLGCGTSHEFVKRMEQAKIVFVQNLTDGQCRVQLRPDA